MTASTECLKEDDQLIGSDEDRELIGVRFP